MATITFTDKKMFFSLLERENLKHTDCYRLAYYPYVSLANFCGITSLNEKMICKNIEDTNIWQFMQITSLLFGVGSEEALNILNNEMQNEPLRSAIIASQLHPNPQERIIVYIETACKILLSINKKGTGLQNLINVRIDGKMPFRLLSPNLQNKGDEWFQNFVNIKLATLRKAYNCIGTEKIYPFFLTSIASSLYLFSPSRYNISRCNDENEMLHLILKTFTKQMIKSSINNKIKLL